ncbi:MAG TPA: hypothetical protein VF507_07405 [Pyrinomonadaceae bacterium]|jgi:hypothetical protein
MGDGLKKQADGRRLARCIELARRALFDLKLCEDAGRAAELAPAHLARIRRARRELNELLGETKEERCQPLT